MKLCLKILASAAIAATTYSLVSCATPNGFSYQNVTLSFTANCTNCPTGITFNPLYPVPAHITDINSSANGGGTGYSSAVPAGAVLTMPNAGEGGTIWLTATVNNAPTNVTWQLLPAPNLGSVDTFPTSTTQPTGTAPGSSNTGSFVTPSSSNLTATGPTVFYYSAGTPNAYSGVQLQAANAMMANFGLPGVSPNGFVEIVATAPSDPNNPSATVSASMLIQAYSSTPSVFLIPASPTTPAGLTNPVVTVARNATFQFTGGAYGGPPCGGTACGTLPVGTPDTAVIWEVGASTAAASAACNTPNGNGQSASQCPNGWISSTGLYTAPPTIPSGNTVVVAAAHSVSTVTKYAYVGID